MSKLNKQQKINKPRKRRKPFNYQRFLIVITIILYIIIQIAVSLQDTKPTTGTITIQELYKLINNGEIESVKVTKNSNSVLVTKTNGETVDAINPQNDTFIHDLANLGVEVSVQKTKLSDSLFQLASTIPMMIIMAMLLIYMANTIVGGSTKMFTILKTKNNHVTFDDIKGLGKTKEEVQFIVQQMDNWKQLGELGARPCKGALLYGPPGTGKTLLAKAIAKEANVNFISASGSDFNEVFVGLGAARVRSLWQLAEANSPCIIFLDEIDSLGKRRRGGDGATSELNQTLNCLLQKMDGLNTINGIMVIGATNRKEDLDPALLRPGRFDRHYYVGAPDNKKDRDEIVEIYLENKKLDKEVTLETASKLLVGLTGAEIEESLSEAVYVSLKNGRDGIIQLRDIDEAVMKLHTGGVEKKHSSERDEQIVAIHEAGHTITSLVLGTDISKVSIIPYSSGTGGITMKDLDKTGDIKLKTLTEYENEIKILLAGKVAEDIMYDEHTQGCSNDIEKATELIYRIVTSYGFDDSALFNENVLISSGIQHSISKNTLDMCNEKLEEYNIATKNILEEHKEELLKLRDLLLDKKTIVNPTLSMLK